MSEKEKNEHQYGYGDEGAPSVTDRMAAWITGAYAVEFIEWLLRDFTKMTKFRNFIFQDTDLNRMWHEWIESELGCWVEKNDHETTFWKMKFIHRFSEDKQGEHLLQFFKDRVQGLLIAEVADKEEE